MHFTLRTAVLSLALCAAGPSFAGASAVARIENLNFTLLDLDLNDGIAPSFQWVVGDPASEFRQRTELTVNVANTPLGESDGSISADFSFLAPLNLVRSVTAEIAASHSGAAGLSASASSGALGSASSFASAESNIAFDGNYGLLISPMTQLTVTADAVVTAADGGAPGAQGFAFEHANASSFIRLRAGNLGGGAFVQDSYSPRSASTPIDALASFEDASGGLSVTLQNTGLGGLYGYLSLRSTAAAYGVTPVPEPSTWALGLAGLAALALRRRFAR